MREHLRNIRKHKHVWITQQRSQQLFIWDWFNLSLFQWELIRKWKLKSIIDIKHARQHQETEYQSVWSCRWLKFTWLFLSCCSVSGRILLNSRRKTWSHSRRLWIFYLANYVDLPVNFKYKHKCIRMSLYKYLLEWMANFKIYYDFIPIYKKVFICIFFTGYKK